MVYPRVDPVALVLVEAQDGEAILLTRQARFPRGLYTLVSGYVEVGESVEAAAAREVLEETGVHVQTDAVRLVASQPFLFHGCELLLGCAAVAAEAGRPPIDCQRPGDGGGELEDAAWVPREEVLGLLREAPPGRPPRRAAGPAQEANDIVNWIMNYHSGSENSGN